MYIKYFNKFILLFLIILVNILSEISAATVLTNLNFNQDIFNLMIGREIELKQIEEVIKEKHNVSISGLPGVGKSYLSVFYAISHINDYDIIWRIDCKNNIYKEYKIFSQAINSTFKKKFIDLSYSENLINSLKEFLRKTEYKWLIIYDNYSLQKNNEKFFPICECKKNYLLVKNIQLSDINLKEMTFTDRVNLFKKISKLDNITDIKDIIETCYLDNTVDLIKAAEKKQRGHPVILSIESNKKCMLPAMNMHDPINEILLRLQNNHPGSYKLIQYLSMFDSSCINLSFIKYIYLLNVSAKESDFYNDLDILISKHLLYYCESNNYIKLPGKVRTILLNNITTNKEQKVFKDLFVGIMQYIKNNLFFEHKTNANHLIYNHIYNIINIGKIVDCKKEVLELYFKLIDYHIKFNRNLKEINNLLQSVANTFDNKHISGKTKIKYLPKLSNYYFMLGNLDKSLKIEQDLNKLLNVHKHHFNKKEIKNNMIFNKIMLLKIYSNMGDISNCKLINIPELEEHKIDLELLYLKSHYMEVKSYIKYLNGDLIGALNDIDNALSIAFNLAKILNAESNIYYTCAHLFSKKYLYMFELGLNVDTIHSIYRKIYAQAINKDDKSVASIKMIYGYIQGNYENLNLGIQNLKSSINIYKDLYKTQSNKNLSIAYTFLGDLYFKNKNFIKAEKCYINAINILSKCYIEYKTYDYKSLLKKLIITANMNSNYILLKYYYKRYLNIYNEHLQIDFGVS